MTKQNGKQFKLPTVKTHEYDVVKGTKFNVSAYIQTIHNNHLAEGTVELNYKEDQIRMSGESISLDLATGQLKGKKVNARQ